MSSTKKTNPSSAKASDSRPVAQAAAGAEEGAQRPGAQAQLGAQ
ncbi:MAG TPA: hypothetical protein VM822_11035 [Pseudolabrys sp.]|nr:hypothetical protein [Pseudolabrys sp.]